MLRADPRIPGYKRKLVAEARRLHLHVPAGFSMKAPWCGKQCQWLLGVYQKARHLPVTHRFDDATCFALDHPPQGPISKREHATRIALSFEGVHEEPMRSNRGPYVDKFIRAGEGVVIAEPWCADFVTYCEDGAGVKLPAFYYPGAFDWLDAAKKGRGGMRTISIDELQRGDLVVWSFSHISRFLAHATLPNGPALETIDGNASDAVRRCTRPQSLVLGCIRMPA